METRRIEDIKIGSRHRKNLGNIPELIKSIRELGLLQPIVITEENTLVAGQRRVNACRALNWQEIPVRVVDIEDPLRAEHDENTVRKDFTKSELVAIGQAIKSAIAGAAEERMKAGKKASQNSDEDQEKGRTDEKVAAKVGMSRDTYRKVEAVVEAAGDEFLPEPEREIAAAAMEEMDSTGKVDPAYKKLRGSGGAVYVEATRPPKLNVPKVLRKTEQNLDTSCTLIESLSLAGLDADLCSDIAQELTDRAKRLTKVARKLEQQAERTRAKDTEQAEISAARKAERKAKQAAFVPAPFGVDGALVAANAAIGIAEVRLAHAKAADPS